MADPVYVITYDVGTTSLKSCLFAIGDKITLVDAAMAGYELHILPNGGAEQDPLDWWTAMVATTRELLAKTVVDPRHIAGVSFCSQMQGLVLVDADGEPIRPMMSYMDQRAGAEQREGIGHGLRVAGMNVFKLMKSLRETGAVAASVKDPVWKYKWVEKHEPDRFRRVHKWLDVKEFLIHRCTGVFAMTEDSAFATLLYGIRAGRRGWSEGICRMFGVNMDHLPDIVGATEQVGGLSMTAAEQLGLAPDTPVYGGGGDASLVGIGAGAVGLHDTHVYMGTSGWVSTVVDRSVVDTGAMIAAIVGAQPGKYNYFAELETAGKCLEWVRDHLALDEIGIYLEKVPVHKSKEAVYVSLYDYLSEVIDRAPAGSGGVMFTPWLHGNRCPFEDTNARAMFFNISLDTGKTELIRAVVEGVCFHMRWMLEAQEKKVTTSSTIRFVGGGALSEATGQILADVLQRDVETVANPQNVGTLGAAAIVAVGLGLIPSVAETKQFIPAEKRFRPNPAHRPVYDRHYEVFRRLYASNKRNFGLLNAISD